MHPKNAFYNVLGKEVVKNLEKRGFEACYVETSVAALDAVKKMIPEGAFVTWGGTMTLEEAGIKEYLKSGKFNALDRAEAEGPEALKEVYRKSFSADYYFMSANALTRDGVLVNIDGNGNRVAALSYGPENVVVIAGMNKLALNEEEALARIHNEASPINAQRLERNTPCGATGSCNDCLSPDCMCSHTLYTRRSHPAGRIKVILVGEDLGY